MDRECLLHVDNLHVQFGAKTVVHGVSFEIYPGEVLALVGESGSGKSVTAMSMVGLVPATYPAGEIVWRGKPYLHEGAGFYQRLRGKSIAVVFQEPMTSLNPTMRIGDQIVEPLQVHRIGTAASRQQRALQLLVDCGVPEPELRLRQYPHELSGGMKQRVCIAIALAAEPDLLICDEPTTALDVTVQAQILDLLQGLQRQRGMALLFITHDLGVVAQLADRVAVMQRGSIVEQADVVKLFDAPQHPYTKGLLACRPAATPPGQRLPLVRDFLDEKDA
jgi:ABC-type dipeptide/oligopeptide/nickel transport system ATPase component